MISLVNIIGMPLGFGHGSGSGLAQLPACIADDAISWHKSLNTHVDEGDTYPYVKDAIGTRTDAIYIGQYLDATS